MVELTLNVPGLLAQSPAPTTSSRYKFVSSQNIVDRLDSWGWKPKRAFYKKTRVVDPLHARHCIRFGHGELTEVGDSRPEIIMFNSHDGRSALELLCGIYRMVCSNGMTICEEEFEAFNIPHKGYKAGRKYIDHAIDVLSKQATRTDQFIKGWNDIALHGAAKREYYHRAMPLRFPEYEKGEEWIFDVPKREEDKGSSLWKVFNRCQEHILTGGFNVTHTAGKKPRQARELSNIDVVNDINENLWSLTSEFAGAYSVN